MRDRDSVVTPLQLTENLGIKKHAAQGANQTPVSYQAHTTLSSDHFNVHYYQYTRPNKKLPSRKHALVVSDFEFDGLQTHLRFGLVYGSSSDEY